jgi:hypothetical protein
MECVLVWELILLSRRQQAETSLYPAFERCALGRLIMERMRVLICQKNQAEQLMAQSLLPLPKAQPDLAADKLIFTEPFVLAALLQGTAHRIGALSYIIRSPMLNQPLRRIATEWLRQETVLLEEQVKVSCLAVMH